MSNTKPQFAISFELNGERSYLAEDQDGYVYDTVHLMNEEVMLFDSDVEAGYFVISNKYRNDFKNVINEDTNVQIINV